MKKKKILFYIFAENYLFLK